MPQNEETGSRGSFGSDMAGIGSLLTGIDAITSGSFGKKESSGRNLGAKEDEFNQRAYYSYGITPYELISNGGAGKGGGIAQGEAMSARNHDAQMKAVLKDLALKERDIKTQKRNVDVQTQAQKDAAAINAAASMYSADKSYQLGSETKLPLGKVNIMDMLNRAGKGYGEVWKQIKKLLGNNSGEYKVPPPAPRKHPPRAIVERKASGIH